MNSWGAGCPFLRLTDTNQPPAGWAKAAPIRESSTPHPASGGLSSSGPVPARWCENGVTRSFEFAFLLLRRRRGSFRQHVGRLDSVFYCSVHVLHPSPSDLLSFLRDLSETLTYSGMSSSTSSLDLFSVSGVSFWGFFLRNTHHSSLEFLSLICYDQLCVFFP